MANDTKQCDLLKLIKAQNLMVAKDYLGAQKLLLEVLINLPPAYEKISKSGDRLHFEYWDEDEFEAFLAYYATTPERCEVTGSQSVYPKALFNLAFIEIENGNLELAHCYLQQILGIEPDQPRCYTELAGILALNEEYAEALKLYSKAMTIRPYHPNQLKALILRGMAFQHIELGNLEKAESLLRDSQNYEPNNKLAQNELIYIADLKGGAPKINGSIWNNERSSPPHIPICCQCGKRLVISKDQFSVVPQDGANFYLCASCEDQFNKAQELKLQGDKAYQSGDYPAAIEALSAVLEITPNDAQSACNRGVCFLNLKEFEKAVADCSLAIGLEPETFPPYFNRGIALYELGSPIDALTDFSKVTELAPEYEGACLWSGLCQMALGNHDSAILEYTKAIEVNPEFAEAYFNRSHTFMAAGNFTKALADANCLVGLLPQNGDAFFLRGRIHSSVEKYDDAIADLERAVSLDLSNKRYLLFLASAYNAQKRSDEAREILNGLIENNDTESPLAEIFKERGISYMDQADYKLALEDFERAAKINGTPYLHACIATAFQHLEKYNEAVEHYSLVLEENPDAISIYNCRAKAFEVMEKYEEAIIDLTKVVAAEPENPDALFRRAECYSSLDRYEYAAVDYLRVVDLEPSFIMPYCGCAIAYCELDEFDAAYNLLQKALMVDPASILPIIIKAGLLASQKRFDEALREVEEAAAQNPGSPDIEKTKIQILADRDKVLCNQV